MSYDQAEACVSAYRMGVREPFDKLKGTPRMLAELYLLEWTRMIHQPLGDLHFLAGLGPRVSFSEGEAMRVAAIYNRIKG